MKGNRDVYCYDDMEVICDGGEEEDNPQLSQEELIAATVSNVLDKLNNNDNEPVVDPPAVDPFDFDNMDMNTDINNQNVDNQVPDNQGNQDAQLYDPRFNDLSAGLQENNKMTRMNSFMMELNNEIADTPGLGIHRNEAINEAKKAINSGGYIPAGNMLSYLHGQADIAKMRNKETNPNPSIGGETELNPDGNDKPFDLEAATADEIKEKYGNIMW